MDGEYSHWLGWLVAVLVAIVNGWFGWKRNKSNNQFKQQLAFYETLLAEVKSLRDENLQLKDEIRQCRSEVEKLEEKLEYYERNPANSYARQLFAAVVDAIKHPVWVHDIGNNRWYLNEAYCKQFSVERRDFWTPLNLFGRYKPEDVAAYVENDLQVIQTNTAIEFRESVRKRVLDPHCDERYYGLFRKSPVFIGEQPFVLGECLELNEEAS